MVYVTGKSQIMRRRFAPFIVVGASVALALLVVAPAASAEASEGLIPTPPAATNGVAPVEQVSATVASTVPGEQPEVPAPSAGAQPIEKPEATSVTDSARTAVASVSSNPPASGSAPPAGAAGRSVAAIAGSVSHRTASLAPAGTGPEVAIAPVAKHHVQALAENIENIARDSSERIASIGRGATATLSPLAERLAAGPADISLPPLLNPSVPATVETMLPPPGPSTGDEAPRDDALSFPELQPGFFAAWSPIASSELTGDYLTLSEIGKVGAAGVALNRLEAPGKSLLAAAGSTRLSSSGTTPGHVGPTSPTPLDAPLPAPGAIAHGMGDSSFVPFAALLALLALVAPASMRRLREAPDFRAPTPFVCALERPG